MISSITATEYQFGFISCIISFISLLNRSGLSSYFVIRQVARFRVKSALIDWPSRPFCTGQHLSQEIAGAT
jgi:hypothetical protein